VGDPAVIPPVVLRPLVCPYCGSRISAELIYTAHYSEHRDLDSYSCDDCGADWAKDGAPTCGPDEYFWRIGKPEDAVPPWLVAP
jgi:DNA-directed RNA polymerase subunit RPC12/RpoP